MGYSLLDAALTMFGAGTCLFLGSACIAAGLHLGARLGGHLFGPIKAPRINYDVRVSSTPVSGSMDGGAA